MTLSRVALVILTASIAAGVLFFGAGEIFSHSAARIIGPPPSNFPAQVVQIDNPPTGPLVGWLAPGKRGGGVVLLFHGVRSDRTQMLARARFLQRAGYATLLIDLPAHGESAGKRITFGAHEAAGVRAAFEYVRRTLPNERIGAIGVSLGAASIVLAHVRPAPDAVILESMYPTIEEAVANRIQMRLGSLAANLAPVLLWQLPFWTGVSAHELRPIGEIPRLGAPVLIISGAEDKHTMWLETQRLFDEAAEPKELWRVDGAAHVDLHAFAPDAYEVRVLSFLAKRLGAE